MLLLVSIEWWRGDGVGLIFHFLFHLVKMFKSYFGADYKAVWIGMDEIMIRIIYVTSSLWYMRFSMVELVCVVDR